MRSLPFSLSLVVGLVVGCNNHEVKHNKDFEKSIYSMVKDHNNREIEVNSIADFKWDKAYLFEPYSPEEHIEKQLGVEFNDPSNISSRDDIYLLVFLHEGIVTQYAEINRQKGNFSTGGKEYLSPSEDGLKIESQ
ncbi:hypothetical protein [Rossellomorea sp. LjRoot5]|uniref:hypothetical protein n=1 Tax=Rossellomorea sp. LjRoot5 TaxID=3342331 RepID=UPI003ECD6DD3